jgi:leucine dehydrogenase
MRAGTIGNDRVAADLPAASSPRRTPYHWPHWGRSSGGVIHAWGVESLGWDYDLVEARLVGIGDRLAAIYARAEAEGITTEAAAERLARSRLDGA